MGNKERRRKHESVRKVPMVVRRHIVRGDKSGSKYTMDKTSTNTVECPQCHKPFKDIGSFIHHMWVMHEWQSTQTLIYWGDNYGVIESAEKEV